MALTHIGPFHYTRFAPCLPALEQGREPVRHPVLIAGGGPVGLATALGLARWGIRSVILEADDSVCEGSRAACISRRSLEILERLGVARAFLAKGLPWTRGRSFYGEEEVLRFDMPSSPDDKFPPMINLQQYYMEQYLLDEIGRLNAQTPGLVDVRWQTRVTGLQHGPEGVTVAVETPLGGYETSSDWLVACDGGQSFVRTSLGLELKGVGYQGRYAIVDIELASPHPTERRAWFDAPWARGTTILMHRQPDNLWRIDYQLAAGQDAQEVMKEDQVNAFVQRHLDAIGEGHRPWTPVWSSVYRAGAMTLDSYRQGRILFAGNAAHAMPIFGVRGLNSGFDDADNLAWKLAARIQGRAGDDLLDTYSQERVGAFHINAGHAMRSTEFMSPPHRGFELMREAVLSLAGRHSPLAALVNPRQTQAITYEGSALSVGTGSFESGPSLGAPLTEVKLGEGRYLTDLLSPQAFTLLCFSDRALTWPDPPDPSRVLTCRPAVVPGGARAAQACGALPGEAWLVRPDGHLSARWALPEPHAVWAAVDHACCLERSAS